MNTYIGRSLLGAGLLASALIAQSGPARSEPGMETRQEAQGNLSVEERIASWKGERIVLIARPGESSMTRNLYKKGNRNTALPADLYDGKTGAIVDTEYNGYRYQLVIQLDEPAEELVYSGDNSRSGIVFASELKMVHGLAGETVWSQGKLRLKKPGKIVGFLNPYLPFGTPLRILDGRMAYGGPVFKVRTADGQEGEVRLAWPKNCLEQRLHPGCERGWRNTPSFYLEDPRKLFPRWSNNTWKKIKSHKVWPGMTFAMLEAVCGSYLRLIGGQLEGGKIHDVYWCDSKKVIVSSSKNIVLKWELR